MHKYRTLLALQDRFLLDAVPNASFAFSFRKLRKDYTGNCIRVRRTSDNAETDIGFVNNYLDIATLVSFTGSSDGRVTTWYDQSGNTRNAVQATATNQPLIITNGNFVDIFGNTVSSSNKIAFNISPNQHFTCANMVGNQTYVATHLITRTKATNQDAIWVSAPATETGTNNATGYRIQANRTSNNRYGHEARRVLSDNAVFVDSTENHNNNTRIITGITSYTTGELWLRENQTQYYTQQDFDSGNGTMANITRVMSLFKSPSVAGLQFTNGYCSEIVLYNSAKDNSKIEKNMNKHYEVF
jgi:hypothetical protein